MIPTQFFISGDDTESSTSPDLGYGNEIDIPYSIRIDKTNSAYFTKTYDITELDDSNNKIKTFSFWVKRGVFGDTQTLIANSTDANNYWSIHFDTSDRLVIVQNSTTLHGGIILNKVSSRIFRDIASWYNIIIIVNTTNIIAEDRVKVYVNGSRITAWDTNVIPSLNRLAVSYFNYQSLTYYSNIGRFPALNTNFLDGCIAEMHVVDGQELKQYHFGKFSSETGQWVPVEYLGSYGNNGFHLKFDNTTSVSTLGNDSSGGNNHWSSTNINLTSGVSYDSFIDTPTNNFAVLNTNTQNNIITYRKNNLQTSSAGLPLAWLKHDTATMVIPANGKYYWEFQNSGSTNPDHVVIGLMLHYLPVATVAPAHTLGNFVGSYGAYVCRSANTDLAYVVNGGTGTTFGSHAEGDLAPGVLGAVWGFAFDADNNQFQLFKNGVSLGTRSILSTHSGQLVPAISMYNGNMNVNFGQLPFAHTPPTGHIALCSKNLPTPTIKRGDIGFDIATYTGNGGNIQVGEYNFPIYDYLIDKSLRFNSILSSKLTKTYSSAGNGQVWTYSTWFKRSKFDIQNSLISAYFTDATEKNISITINENSVQVGVGASLPYTTNQNFIVSSIKRKDNDWHHLVIQFDTTQAVASNRVKCYIDGLLSANIATGFPNQNTTYPICSNTPHTIGANAELSSVSGIQFFDGYMTEVYLIDGQIINPDSFGQFDINGYWIPKSYLGTFGQNGFYLDFEDTSSLPNLGLDKSGNNNNWTPNNISLTAGITYDSMNDSPTNSHSIIDTLNVYGPINISNSGLSISTTTGNCWVQTNYMLPNSGKYYWEYTMTNTQGLFARDVVGFIRQSTAKTGYFTQTSSSIGYYCQGAIQTANAGLVGVSAYTTNDVVGVYVDCDTGEVWFTKNGTSVYGDVGISTPACILDRNYKWFPAFGPVSNAGGYGMEGSINFGQRPFEYMPLIGFNTLTIPNISEYTYDLESPDLVWIKSRNSTTNHILFDSIRGVGKYLQTNLPTNVEATDTNSLISFNKNGFYLGENTNVNTLNSNYVAWMWKAGNSQVSNTNGTITSQIKTNPTTGFSVVKYTGNGIASTVGHGLGLPVKFIIAKQIGASSNNWRIGHSDLTGWNYQLSFETTAQTLNTGIWNSTAPTSQVFSIGNNSTINTNGGEYIAYCFSEINGYSKFGSYKGNGVVDGTFVYCGFKPRFILIKRIDVASNWFIWDTERDTENVTESYLLADTSGVEFGTVHMDILANGFKMRSATIANVSAATYIFAAFSETSIKYSNAK
jgi:hypothetical protein